MLINLCSPIRRRQLTVLAMRMPALVLLHSTMYALVQGPVAKVLGDSGWWQQSWPASHIDYLQYLAAPISLLLTFADDTQLRQFYANSISTIALLQMNFHLAYGLTTYSQTTDQQFNNPVAFTVHIVAMLCIDLTFISLVRSNVTDSRVIRSLKLSSFFSHTLSAVVLHLEQDRKSTVISSDALADCAVIASFVWFVTSLSAALCRTAVHFYNKYMTMKRSQFCVSLWNSARAPSFISWLATLFLSIFHLTVTEPHQLIDSPVEFLQRAINDATSTIPLFVAASIGVGYLTQLATRLVRQFVYGSSSSADVADFGLSETAMMAFFALQLSCIRSDVDFLYYARITFCNFVCIWSLKTVNKVMHQMQLVQHRSLRSDLCSNLVCLCVYSVSLIHSWPVFYVPRFNCHVDVPWLNYTLVMSQPMNPIPIFGTTINAVYMILFYCFSKFDEDVDSCRVVSKLLRRLFHLIFLANDVAFFVFVACDAITNYAKYDVNNADSTSRIIAEQLVVVLALRAVFLFEIRRRWKVWLDRLLVERALFALPSPDATDPRLTADVCPVCLGPLEQPDEDCVTPCGHLYHKNCLLMCAAIQPLTCPMCRAAIETG